MNNKKIQAQMQIDVSFLSKGLTLTKDIQSQLDRIKLTGINKQFSDDITKHLKSIESSYNKMIAGLSKKGLTSKQYSQIFEEGSLAIKKNIDSIKEVGKAIKDSYNSKEQKEWLKGLEAEKGLLQDIKRIRSEMKKDTTRSGTTAKKIKDEFGLDINNKEAYKVIQGIANKKGANLSLTPTQKKALGKDADDEAKIKRLITLYDQYEATQKRIADRQSQINSLGGEEYIQKQIDLFNKNIISAEQLASSLGLVENASKNLAPSLENFDKILNKSASDAEKAAKASQSFKEVLAQFGIVFSAASLARGVRDLIKGSFDFYKSLDSALNEIYVVSNLTSKEVDGLKNNFINMAKETGMALDDVTRSAVLFYQQGLNTQEVMTMTEVTAQFAKVAGIDATDAADKLTAAVNGYCLSAENAAEVADKFNKVAAVSAADINELSTAFSKAAAQANQAGVSMDNYLAYIATMEEATREAPENLGTSLKTIFSRMQQIKTGENTEDNVDVNAVETALRSVGIQLRDTEGQLRDLEEIFDELGPKWNSLNRNTQAYLGTIIAGTRQQSRFITLMQNWSRVQDLAAESENSAGQQALMHAKAMESIESKLNQLTVAWQEFVSNLTSSSTFKTVIDLMKGFLNLINGGAKPVMLLTTAVGLFANKLKDLQSPLAKKAEELKGLFGKGKTLLSHDEKKSKLKENADARKELEDAIALNAEKMRQLVLEGKATEQETQELATQNEIHQRNLSQLEKEKAVIESTNTDLDKKAAKWKAIGGIVTTIGLTVGQQDETLGGMLTGAGVAATGFGQILSGNYIGGAISLITGGIQFFKAWGDAAENAKRKMVDAVEKVKKDTEGLVNTGTQSRELKRLIDRYQELHNKTYKTKQEQEELNEVIQAMGDSQGIEVLTDEFGNLSISIDKVIEKYNELLQKQKDLLTDVQASEQKQMDKATSGFMNNNTAGQYIDKLYSELKSDYRNLLTGIQDLSIDGVREVSKSTYDKLNIALKDSIQTIIGQDKSANFYNGGFARSTVDLQNSLNQKLQQEDGWNYVYAQVDKLQKQVDNLSWDEFNGSMEDMFGEWRKNLKLTETEYQVLQRTIATTLYGNAEYVNYMESTDIDKLKKRYQEIFKNVEAQKETTGLTQQFINEAGIKSMYIRAFLPGRSVGGISTSTTKEYTTIAKGFDEIWAIYEKGGEKAIDRVWMDLTDKGIRYNKSEVLQMLQDYEKQVKEIGKNAMEVRNLMAGLSGNRLQKLQSTSALFDNSAFAITDKDDKAEQERKKVAKEQYNGIVADIIKNTEGWTNETDIGLAITEMINKQLESGEIKDETVINQLIKLREEVESELPRVSSFTWSGILDNVENYASDLQKVNKALIELNDTGAITSSTFSDLASVMDSLDLSAVYESFSNRDEGLNYIHALTESMKNLNVQYDANTGMLKVNAESLEFLQDAQERQAKGKIKSMINDLYATKASVESQIAYIDAQIAAVEQMEKAIVNLGDGNITEKELMSQADNAYTTSLGESMQTIDSNYEKLTESSLQWAKASIFQISEVTDAWDKYWQAVRGGAVNAGELRKTAEGLTSNYTKQMFDTSGIDLSKYEGVKANSAKGKELIQKLQDYRIGLTEAREEYAKTLSLYDGQIAMLESLYNSDLSNWGNEKDGDSSKLQKYIGQLKEIYNILNRIQMLEHRLSTLDTYSEIAKSKDYGELLQQRLGYNDELLGQYKFLVSEQKQFTNGYKDFINSVDGLEGVFDFDQFGQIIINWEKYNALQDEAVEGEISLKEKADDVYNTYTSMMSELQGYFDKYISYLKNTLDLLNEMKDNYVDLESKAAAAVQEIYKKELDAKLEAIDKEMKALEELTQARQKANKERDNAKVLSGYQADLQRAMMDTSGASDANYIKAQQNISDKLDAMAEDKYSEMINDIKKQLEEEKDVLQKNFDELFENQEWLYSYLENDIMSDKTQLYQLLQGTDEWAKKSPTERWQDMKDWDTKFFSYAESGIFGKEGIKGILDSIDAKETEYKNLDEALKNQNSKGDANIIQTIENWGQKVANAASSSGGDGGSNYNGGSVTFNNDKTYGGSPNTYTKASIGAYNVPINTDVKYGTFSTVSDDGVLYQPDNYKNVKLKSTGKKAIDAGIQFNSSGMDVSTQNIWKAGSRWLIWNGTKGIYEEAKDLFNKYGNMKLAEAINYCRDRRFFVDLFEAAGARGLSKFASGGFANFTGPAWLDGTPSAPEAVLDALQTKHFIDFTNTLDKMYSNVGQAGVSNASNVTIDNISFNVESMSSPEDGEKAFNAFVDKFKEIGDRTGLKVQTFKNTL